MNEVEERARAEFERILERDHGVSREEDRELIEGLWTILDPEDKAYASNNLKTGVQDLVMDARESRLYKYYMGFRRGKVAHEPAEPTAQSEETNSAATTEIKGLDAELLGGGGEVSDNRLKATTRARVEALSEYLSRIIATDRAVVRFRDRVLGDPENTLSPEGATELIHSLVAEQQPGLPRDAETLWWSGDNDAANAEAIAVWPGSELWYLKSISRRLSKLLPWTECQACYFILTGRPIRVATISGRVSKRDTGVAAHGYLRNTITLEIDAWMPSEYVRHAYHNLQHDLLGANNRQPELRNVKVFHFVVSHSELRILNREEGLAKLIVPAEWKELRELWNKRYPEDHEWHYHRKKEHRFSRDFYRGQEVMIGTQYGLPGAPGQPRSRAEAQAIKDRLDEPLKVTSRSTATDG